MSADRPSAWAAAEARKFVGIVGTEDRLTFDVDGLAYVFDDIRRGALEEAARAADAREARSRDHVFSARSKEGAAIYATRADACAAVAGDIRALHTPPERTTVAT